MPQKYHLPFVMNNIVEYFIKNAENIKIKFFKSDKDNVSRDFYNSLAPTDNAEECDVYLESLQWALDNKNKIKNIAVSGPYGSGKSSILQTFIKKHKDSHKYRPRYRFFNISLATFKDDKKIKNGSNDEEKKVIGNFSDDELQRLIELSILQQLFFHEKDSKIPDSRFKKIKRQKRTFLFLYTIGLIALLISILFLLVPEFLAKFSIVWYDQKYEKILRIIASSITLLGLFFITYKISRSIIGFSIKKLKINSAEIEIDQKISKSILNNHLDEIIYFFEATKYNVVIIEDLDRFEQSEVFTKLREINLLINNSEKVKRDIVFIYAIKDDMFLDKDRAKFFDFMIPIIPVINFSNSGNKLRDIVKRNNYNIKEDLLDDLSMFIDDMRLLYNIMNEFYIYSKKINNGLDQNKLLSMIVYKNIYPNDFAKLNENEGDLYNTIRKKSDYILKVLGDLDKDISKIKNEIKRVEEQQFRDVKELRIVYATKVADEISYEFSGFRYKNEKKSIYEFTKKEHVDFLKRGEISYYEQYGTRSKSIDFSVLEKEVNPELTYDQREKLVLDKSKTNNLKKEIENLNLKKNLVQKSSLKEILSNKYIRVETDSINKNDLINILLRNGYIDENYLDYISIFHEGALTKVDYQFLINLKTEKATEFDYKLHKTEELIKKINEFAFEKEYVLNFDLVETILKSDNYTSKRDKLFKQLGNESDNAIKFIDQFIDRTTEIELFVSLLCKEWLGIWDFVYQESKYTEDRIDKYFQLIIHYATLDDIKVIFDNHIEYLNNYSNLLNIQCQVNRIKDIVRELDLKFESLNEDSPEDYLDYVFKNNHYCISIEMIQMLLSFYNDYEEKEFRESNYSYILSSKHTYLQDYIETNITDYVSDVLLQLENNVEEKIKSYLKLLNNGKIKLALKEKVIIKTNTIINEISDVKDLDICDLLFKNLKIDPTWNNILNSYKDHENELCDEVVSFLNDLSIAERLSKIRIDSKGEDSDLYSSLCKTLVYCKELSFESYKLLMKSIPWWYETFDAEKLSEERIEILIETRNVNPTIDSFNYLQENFKEKSVLLLEDYFSYFNDKIEELAEIINSDDLEKVLKSVRIESKYKFEIINYLDDDEVLENTENLKLLTELLLVEENCKVSTLLLYKLIEKQNISTSDRIRLFDKFISEEDKIEIGDFLTSLGQPYKEIINMSKKAILMNNPIHIKLLKKLKELNYISSFSIIEKGLRVNHKKSR